jgi:hypothetical protein
VKTLIEAGAQVDGGSWFDALHGGDEEAIQFIEAQLEIVQDWFDEIDEIDDQGILAKTAVKSGYEEVRDAAVRRVTDLSLLEQIAETAPSADVREAAVDRWVSLSS